VSGDGGIEGVALLLAIRSQLTTIELGLTLGRTAGAVNTHPSYIVAANRFIVRRLRRLSGLAADSALISM
jgi:hypothetical protein